MAKAKSIASYKVSPVSSKPELTKTNFDNFPKIEPHRFRLNRTGKWILVAILVLVGFILIFGWPIVAIVNQKPIFRWELNSTLQMHFGQQTLDQMISERLISAEAQRQGVTVTPAEITARTNEIVKGLGENVNLDELLQMQGITRKDFEDQLRLQLAVTKILSKNLKIADQDIDNYIATNRALLTATGEAQLRAEAKQAILDQKVSEQLQTWFADLKQKAKIWRLF